MLTEATALLQSFIIDRAIDRAMVRLLGQNTTYYGYQLATQVAPDPALNQVL